MRRIPSTDVPTEFEQHRQTSGASYPGAPKGLLRRALLDVQKGRCAYCERTIIWDDDDPELWLNKVTVIEHFHPQSKTVSAEDQECLERLDLNPPPIGVNQGVSLEPTNLLLSCDGNRNDTRRSQHTCDKKKGDVHLCADLFNPKTLPIGTDTSIAISADGTASPSYFPGAEPAAVKAVDVTLNLNESRLVDQRRSLWAGYLETTMERISLAPISERHQLLITVVRGLRAAASYQSFGSTLSSLANELDTKRLMNF